MRFSQTSPPHYDSLFEMRVHDRGERGNENVRGNCEIRGEGRGREGKDDIKTMQTRSSTLGQKKMSTQCLFTCAAVHSFRSAKIRAFTYAELF